MSYPYEGHGFDVVLVGHCCGDLEIWIGLDVKCQVFLNSVQSLQKSGNRARV